MLVFIQTPSGDRLSLEVDPSDTLAAVKSQIEQEKRISYDQQRLSYGGRQLYVDSRTMHEYNVTERCTLELTLRLKGGMQVFIIQVTGKSWTFEVELNDRVSSLKARINAREGLPVEQQHLIYGAKPLLDDRTLAEYGIVDNSNIHMVLSLRGGGTGGGCMTW
eukprot:scpid94478/ scgid8171/ Polyubiquitin-C; Ubiquitin-related; Ubiquitin